MHGPNMAARSTGGYGRACSLTHKQNDPLAAAGIFPDGARCGVI